MLIGGSPDGCKKGAIHALSLRPYGKPGHCDDSTASDEPSKCRQVLDCGDRVREVTALAVRLLKIPKRAADTATTTQSGDSEDSVAAVQDARASRSSAQSSNHAIIAERVASVEPPANVRFFSAPAL